jgi:hypothetical protein
MKIYYLPNGELHQALYNADTFRATVDPTALSLEIDEIPENRDLCLQLAAELGRQDADGLGRWYVENGELYERDGWTPEVF